MWSVWVVTPGIQLSGNIFQSPMQRIKGKPATYWSIFLSLFQSHSRILQRHARFWFGRFEHIKADWQLTVVPLLFGSCPVSHPISVNQPGPESKVQTGWQVYAASFSFHQAFCCPCKWKCSIQTQLLASSPCPVSSIKHDSISPDYDH